MNVTTIGFPFGTAPGAPISGTPEQSFALALGVATGLGTPPLPGAVAANDAGTPPAFANDAAPAVPGNPKARTRLGASITLAQLLTTGSEMPATLAAIQPGRIGAGTVPQAPAGAPAAQPVAASAPALPGDAAAKLPTTAPTDIPADTAAPIPARDLPAPAGAKTDPATAQAADAIVPAVSKDAPADPVAPAMTVQADAGIALPCPAAGQPPVPLDLPAATQPKPDGIVSTPTLTTPVKTRKPIAIDADAAALPIDALAAQPGTTPVAIAASAPAPAPAVAAPEPKPDAARGGKTAPVALGQPNAPATDDAMTPAAAPGKEPVASQNPGSNPDAALPAEAARIEARPNAAPLPQQSFAAHVTQNAAPAPIRAAAPAAPASDPMVPARAGQLGHALGVEIARKVEAGDDTLRVRLNPAELGRVEVTLAFDDNGNLRATMRAESRHALELLRQDAPDLGRALDSAGVRSDAQSFRFESRSDGNGASGGQAGQHQSRGNGRHAFNDEPETPAPAYRAIRNDGQVDLLA